MPCSHHVLVLICVAFVASVTKSANISSGEFHVIYKQTKQKKSVGVNKMYRHGPWVYINYHFYSYTVKIK